MQTIQISFVDPSKTGKSVKIKAKGGAIYYAKPEQGLQPGMTVEAQIRESEYQGKQMLWIEAYKPVQAAPAAPNGSNGVAPPWMPFVSNTVAHAISAGLIKEPHELGMWASAARNWATGKAESMEDAASDLPY